MNARTQLWRARKRNEERQTRDHRSVLALERKIYWSLLMSKNRLEHELSVLSIRFEASNQVAGAKITRVQSTLRVKVRDM